MNNEGVPGGRQYKTRISLPTSQGDQRQVRRIYSILTLCSTTKRPPDINNEPAGSAFKPISTLNGFSTVMCRVRRKFSARDVITVRNSFARGSVKHLPGGVMIGMHVCQLTVQMTWSWITVKTVRSWPTCRQAARRRCDPVIQTVGVHEESCRRARMESSRVCSPDATLQSDRSSHQVGANA